MTQFWGILELMGHVRLAGMISEEEKFGAKMGRIDVPVGDDVLHGKEGKNGFVTQYFGGSSVYRLTPCTEEAARAVAKHTSVQPIHTYELPRLRSPDPIRRDVDTSVPATPEDDNTLDDDLHTIDDDDDEGYF